MIPVEDSDKWASQYYRCYSKTRGLICKGDGETAIRMIDLKTGAMADRDTDKVEMREITCEGRKCPDYKIKCKEIMCLQFLLPEVPGLGIWQIDTGSINSIRNINSAAELIKRAYDRISMIPLRLTLEPIEANNPDTGKKQTVYVLNLRTDLTLIEMGKQVNQAVPQLLAGLIDTPVPDDERPDLIAPEFEPDPVELPEKVQAHVNNATPEELTAELYNTEKQAEVVKPEKKTAERLPASVTRVTELITAGFKDFDYQPREMLDILKIKTWPELAITPAEAYVQIKAHWLKDKGK